VLPLLLQVVHLEQDAKEKTNAMVAEKRSTCFIKFHFNLEQIVSLETVKARKGLLPSVSNFIQK
jgi:hypothetical protein